MSKICQITGKKAMVGNNVSHSKEEQREDSKSTYLRKSSIGQNRMYGLA